MAKGEREAEVRFEQTVNKGIETALCMIAANYEGEDFKSRLFYHNTHHTVNVIARTELILRTIALVDPQMVSEHRFQIARLAAGYHDIAMPWREVNGKRLRDAGVGEEESSRRVRGWMYDTRAFSLNDELMVDEAIMATVAKYDPERKLIYQPNLDRGVSIVTVAVALSDLNACGLEGPEVFLRESDLILMEENMDIAEAIVVAKKIDPEWKTRIIKATEFSVNFAKGRKLLIDSEIALLPERVRGAVRELFWGFDKSIAAAEANLERRKEMSIEDLLWELSRVIE